MDFVVFSEKISPIIIIMNIKLIRGRVVGKVRYENSIENPVCDQLLEGTGTTPL